MMLARTIRFDDSDLNVFERPAQPDEWAVSGAFEFSNWTEAEISGKRRQAFANGWLGLETFGRATFVATAQITEAEFDAAADALARHFVECYGAPDLGTARPVAEEELVFMQSLAENHAPNTLLVVERKMIETGVNEAFRAIKPQDAELDLVAIHGTLDEL